MTYADINSMKDMMVDNLEKRRYTPFLLLSRFTDTEFLKTKEALYMLRVWKDELLHFLKQEDAGCVINSGNVLVLIKNNRSEEFLEKVKKLRVLSRTTTLVTDAMVMSDDISQLFLDFA